MRLEFRARQRCAAPQRMGLRMSEHAAVKRTASGAGAIKHVAVEFGEGLLYVGGSLSLARHACPPSVWGRMACGSELILRPGLAKAVNPRRYLPCQAPPHGLRGCAMRDKRWPWQVARGEFRATSLSARSIVVGVRRLHDSLPSLAPSHLEPAS